MANVVKQMQKRDSDKQEASNPSTPEISKSKEPKEQKLTSRASKLQYKTVNEMY